MYEELEVRMQGGRLAEPNSDNRLDVVRLVVFLSLVGDVASSLIAASFGVSGLGRTSVASNVQSLLLVAAVAACLWGRARLTLILSGLVVLLVFVLGPTGAEPWLVLVTGVTIAARAPVRLVLLGALGQVGYALAYGLDTERRRPGSGWQAAVISLAFTGVAFVVGLLARRLLQARDAWRERVRILQQQNAQIRTAERLRLADDLQVAVIRSLADIDEVVSRFDRGGAESGIGGGTAVTLRRGLDRIDGLSRSLSAELRTLLEVLRLDVDPQLGRQASSLGGQRRWARVGQAVRACWSVGCVGSAAALALLAISVDVAVEPRPAATVVQVLTLLAVAVVVWRPGGGAALAGAALVVSPFVSADGAWDVLPAALLCLFVTVRSGPRKLWTVALGVVAYGALVQVAPVDDSLWRTVAVAYIAVLAVITGLVARHLVQARRTSRADVDDLLDERARIEVQERDAVARELHDVVAHQLSVVNLLIMATSASENRDVLRSTLEKVGRSTGVARQELTGLLATMRRSVGDTDGLAEGPGPLVSLRTTLDSLSESLNEQGHQVVVRLDPLADDLDSTTRRTLNRIVQEATTNILRYAPAGSVSRYSLKVGSGTVELEISSPNPAPGRVSDLSLGWGLRGIRERVELLHGTFRAGPQRDRWVVAVSLPLLSGARMAAPAALA